jgi:hypothetical protein
VRRSAWADVALAAAAVLAVTAPLLFTASGFATDFTNHLWLVSAAGRGLVEAGHPSYFLNSLNFVSGVFYPYFAFSGGSLYTITGGVGELLGGRPVIAFVGVAVLAVIGAYGGMLWLGRELGLRGWLAHAPALTVITSAYYITNIYARGDWPEFVATSAIAPLIASGVHLVRASRWRALPVLVFAVSMVLFSGSHNITLLWGTIVIAATLLVLWLALGAPLRLPYRRLAMLGGLGLAGVLVNAWFLLPDTAYASSTFASFLLNGSGKSIWPTTSYFETPAVLLDPLRTVPRQSTTAALYVQAPDWFLAWGLAAGALLLWRSSHSRTLRRAWVGMVAVIALLLGALLIEPLWDIVPEPFARAHLPLRLGTLLFDAVAGLDQIQFPYRLGTYLFYAVAGLVLLGALALQRATASGGSRGLLRALRLALLGACAVSLGLCLWQQWVPNTVLGRSYRNRSEALVGVHNVPRSWEAGPAYRNRSEPVVAFPSKRRLWVYPSEVHGDRFSAWMNVPPGPEPIGTDIGGAGNLVHISGLRRLGRTPVGYAVLGRLDGSSGPVHVTIEMAHTPIIELGWLLSALGILAILATLLFTALRSRRADDP